MTTVPWYAGRCVKVRDLVAEIAVLAREDQDGWVIVDNAHRLFPKIGHVSIKAGAIRAIRDGDWFMFHGASSQGKRGPWKALSPRPLLPFVDLSEIETVERARHVFVQHGSTEPAFSPGTWAVKINETEVLQLDLTRGGDGKYYAVNIDKIHHCRFDIKNKVDMPGEGETVELFDFNSGTSVKTDPYDWSVESDYIVRVVRSLADKDDREIQDIIAWLQLHSDEKSGQVLVGADTARAFDALRSGELARRLSDDLDLLTAFGDALRNDPAMAPLLEDAAKLVAEREASQIRADLKVTFDRELSILKSQKVSELSDELGSFETQRRSEIERRLTEEHRASEQLAQERQLQVETEFHEAQLRLLNEIAAMESNKEALSNELTKLEADRASASADLEDLKLKGENAARDLDRLLAAGSQSHFRHSPNSSAVPIPEWGGATTKITKTEFNDLVSSFKILTPVGKSALKRFLSLLLAGDVPVVVGDSADAFLSITRTLISDGKSATLVADPTVITFEDLWVRPGTNVQTQLGYALGLAKSTPARTVLCTISGADQSGARFWMPALQAMARNGDLPRHFLVCATLSNTESEEAKLILEASVAIDTTGTIEGAAGSLFPILLGPSSRRELEVGEPVADLMPAMEIVETLMEGFDLGRTQRAARAVAELISFSDDSNAATVLARTIIQKGVLSPPVLTVVPGGN